MSKKKTNLRRKRKTEPAVLYAVIEIYVNFSDKEALMEHIEALDDGTAEPLDREFIEVLSNCKTGPLDKWLNDKAEHLEHELDRAEYPTLEKLASSGLSRVESIRAYVENDNMPRAIKAAYELGKSVIQVEVQRNFAQAVADGVQIEMARRKNTGNEKLKTEEQKKYAIDRIDFHMVKHGYGKACVRASSEIRKKYKIDIGPGALKNLHKKSQNRTAV